MLKSLSVIADVRGFTCRLQTVVKAAYAPAGAFGGSQADARSCNYSCSNNGGYITENTDTNRESHPKVAMVSCVTISNGFAYHYCSTSTENLDNQSNYAKTNDSDEDENENNDSIKDNNAKLDNDKYEHANDDNVKDATVQDDTFKVDNVKNSKFKGESVKYVNVNDGNVIDDSVKNDSMKDNDVNYTTINDENGKDETEKYDGVKDENVYDDAVKYDHVKDDNAKDDNAKDDNVKDGNVKDDNVKDDNIKDDKDKDELLDIPSSSRGVLELPVVSQDQAEESGETSMPESVTSATTAAVVLQGDGDIEEKMEDEPAAEETEKSYACLPEEKTGSITHSSESQTLLKQQYDASLAPATALHRTIVDPLSRQLDMRLVRQNLRLVKLHRHPMQVAAEGRRLEDMGVKRIDHILKQREIQRYRAYIIGKRDAPVNPAVEPVYPDWLSFRLFWKKPNGDARWKAFLAHRWQLQKTGPGGLERPATIEDRQKYSSKYIDAWTNSLTVLVKNRARLKDVMDAAFARLGLHQRADFRYTIGCFLYDQRKGKLGAEDTQGPIDVFDATPVREIYRQGATDIFLNVNKAEIYELFPGFFDGSVIGRRKRPPLQEDNEPQKRGKKKGICC